MATMFPALVRLEVMLASSAAAAAAEAPARAAAAARSPYKNPLQQTSGMMIEDRRPTTRNSVSAWCALITIILPSQFQNYPWDRNIAG